MKTYLIILTTVLFSLSFTVVTYILSVQHFERWQVSLMTHVPIALLCIIIHASEYAGLNTQSDRDFQMIGKVNLCVFLIVYCLNSYGLVSGAIHKLFVFYGLNFVGLTMVMVSAYRHGNFKN